MANIKCKLRMQIITKLISNLITLLLLSKRCFMYCVYDDEQQIESMTLNVTSMNVMRCDGGTVFWLNLNLRFSIPRDPRLLWEGFVIQSACFLPQYRASFICAVRVQIVSVKCAV